MAMGLTLAGTTGSGIGLTDPMNIRGSQGPYLSIPPTPGPVRQNLTLWACLSLSPITKILPKLVPSAKVCPNVCPAKVIPLAV